MTECGTLVLQHVLDPCVLPSGHDGQCSTVRPEKDEPHHPSWGEMDDARGTLYSVRNVLLNAKDVLNRTGTTAEMWLVRQNVETALSRVLDALDRIEAYQKRAP
jgi:hypothetical protein